MTSAAASSAIPAGSRYIASKVPAATALFWLVKILSTTVGETGADFLNSTLGLGLTITTWCAAVVLALGLTAQFLTRRYTPVVYWFVVVVISVVGTLFSDNLVDGLGVPLAVSTGAFAAFLAATFVAWWRVEGTLSIHSIVTPRREAFYWLAILFAFALGTSAGDWFAEGIGLGYLPSLLTFAVMLALVALAYFVFHLNAVVAFWIAYVLTRPFGASAGDWLSQARSDGGLGLGTTVTSDVFLAVIAVSVATFTLMDLRARRGARSGLPA